MRLAALLGTVCAALAAAENPAGELLTELKTKREALPGIHEEFDVSQTFKTSHGTQSVKRQIVLDMSKGLWREQSISGSGNYMRIFDGKDVFRMEEGGTEYIRTKRQSKDQDPAPAPYNLSDTDWSKAKEVGRRPYKIQSKDHQCVVIDMPLKRWRRPTTGGHYVSLLEGTVRVVLDTETGVAMGARVVETIDNQRGGYLSDTTYTPKRLSYGAAPDAALFQLPGDLKEVKELSRWNAARIKKSLTGKPAPELAATDLEGKPVTLSAYQGKTVLLDFWTTWCPPCRADAPALAELYRRYGEKDLMIVSFSVSEDRREVSQGASQELPGRADHGKRDAAALPDRRVSYLHRHRSGRHGDGRR